MNRREFTKTCLMCTGLVLLNEQAFSRSTAEDAQDGKNISKESKKVFWKFGCAGALFHALCNKFDMDKTEERNIGLSLSGGIVQSGHQCGMLWGASMAAGALAFKTFKDEGIATAKAINAANSIIKSFSKRANYTDCREITKVDWHRKTGAVKYFATGKLFTCLGIADKWPPEAAEAIDHAFTIDISVEQKAVSCASETVRKMNGSPTDIALAAGLAGGIGLSGKTCGALGAAVWMKSKEWLKNHPDEVFENPEAFKVINAFNNVTGGVTRCEALCKKCFKSVDEYTTFITNGGCERIINAITTA